MLAPCPVNGVDNSEGEGARRTPGWRERRKGRIDRPPDERALAGLPKDFGRRFVVFVDTEEEFDWDKPLRRENTAVSAMEGLPEAQRYFREAGAQPAYLCDWPVVDDERSGAILAEMHAADGCEIGTQLHPWVNPPFEETVTAYNSFTGNLPVDLQRAKLRRLTERITERIGTRPTIYRAGRYGIGKQTAMLLEEEGYRMDASVRALFNYGDEGGPDFSGFANDLFWAGPQRTLLALPLTATFTGRLRRWGWRLFPAGERFGLWRSLLARTGAVQRIALTPEDYPLSSAREAIERLLDDGRRVFSLSYHSPSVVPGHTPYVRDADDLKAFYAWWDGVFDLFAKRGVTAARAREIIDAADRVRLSE